MSVLLPPPHPRIRRRVVATALLLLVTSTGEAMGIFASKVLFSAVEGRVLLNGQPVAGAEVERSYTWSWNKSEGLETVRTDANGAFRFATVRASNALSSLVPHEPVIFQELIIRYQGKKAFAWLYTKHNYDEDGELEGKKLNLECELSREPVNHGTYTGIAVLR